jgi:pimeloyl-ACP methyl ester carboxylesterase
MRSMSRQSVSAGPPGHELVGWVEGTGPPVLLLHGGPGLSYGYLDGLASDLGPAYRVASFQQRGLSPSTTAGPFTVAVAVADVLTFLDALGWDRAFVVGHSWGGHLLLHVAVSAPHRLTGALAVDTLGGVGDGGMATFEHQMSVRTSDGARARAGELDTRALRGEGTAEDLVEGLRLVWPAYFADPAAAPEMPDISASTGAYAGLFASLAAERTALAAALPAVTVAFGFVAGAGSPMPVDEAAAATADLIPGAWLDVVDGAGHFPWYERPGRVRAALDRLVADVGASGGTADDH